MLENITRCYRKWPIEYAECKNTVESVFFGGKMMKSRKRCEK